MEIRSFGDSLKGTCAGCGKSGEKGSVQRFQIAPNTYVLLCWIYRAGRHGYPPKKACWEKALYAAQVCPGCGAKDTPLSTVCYECRERIKAGLTVEVAEARAKELAAERKLTEYGVITDALIPSRLCAELRDSGHEVATLLADAFGESAKSTRTDVPSDMPRIPPRSVQWRAHEGAAVAGTPIYRLAPEQAEALTILFEAIERLFASAFEAGVERGSKPMLRLALGEITADTYNSEIWRNSAHARDTVNETAERQSKKKKTGN